MVAACKGSVWAKSIPCGQYFHPCAPIDNPCGRKSLLCAASNTSCGRKTGLCTLKDDSCRPSDGSRTPSNASCGCTTGPCGCSNAPCKAENGSCERNLPRAAKKVAGRRTKIAHGFNRGFNGQNETSPGGTAENCARKIPARFLSPLRGLICFWNTNPQLKLRAIF